MVVVWTPIQQWLGEKAWRRWVTAVVLLPITVVSIWLLAEGAKNVRKCHMVCTVRVNSNGAKMDGDATATEDPNRCETNAVAVFTVVVCVVALCLLLFVWSAVGYVFYRERQQHRAQTTIASEFMPLTTNSSTLGTRPLGQQ